MLKSPAGITLLVSLLLLALNIMFIGRLRPFNSDDIYWQQALRTWHPFSGETMYLATKDIFVEQLPFLFIMEKLFGPSRGLVIVEVLGMTLSAFIMFYFSALYFLKKLRIRSSYIAFLPFVWLASFGYPLVQNYLNSDWRSFEVGISFATYALVAAVTFGDINPLKSLKSKLLSVLAVGYIGIMIYSDPYFTFFTVAPLALFALFLFWLRKINRTQLQTILGGAIASLFVAKVIGFLARKAGVVIVGDTPSVFVGFDSILTNIISSLHGLLIVYGGDLSGRPAFGLTTFGTMINTALLIFIIAKVLHLWKLLRSDRSRSLPLAQLWAAFFGLLVVFIFIVYTSTTLVAVSNYRFFILLIYSSVLFLVIYLSSTPNRTAKLVIAALLVGGTLFNSAVTFASHNVRSQSDVAGDVSNSKNFAIIDAVRNERMTKGYAGYWQANINSYLSDNKIAFLPSLCDGNGQTLKFKWLVDGGQFNRPADRSFYVIDPSFPAPGVCTESQLSAQFGTPRKVLHIADKTILTYEYDITSKMPRSLPE
jgi:hypothetical protein